MIVTGGAGFIGSHLAAKLLETGNEVHVVDNLVSGRARNLEPFASNPGFTFHHQDIRDRNALDTIVEGADWIFHLAALADIVPSIEQPLDYAAANVEGTFSVLDAAARAGVKRFVYAASSSCYGIPERYPTPEDEPCVPRYPYALTKSLGEQAVLHWAQVFQLPALSLRLFNVYGRRARTSGTYGAVFGVFLAQKLAAVPLTIVGDGEQRRDFVHVSDVVEAFLAAARSDAVGTSYNVGTGAPVSVSRIADLIGGPRVHIPKRPGEPDCTWAETSKIRDAFGWSPKVTIEQGVADLLASIQDWRDAPVWTPDSISTATRAWFQQLGNHDAA